MFAFSKISSSLYRFAHHNSLKFESRHHYLLFISIYVDVHLNDVSTVRRVYPDGHIHNTRNSSPLTSTSFFSTIPVLPLYRSLMCTKLSSILCRSPLSRMLASQFCQKIWIAIPLVFKA